MKTNKTDTKPDSEANDVGCCDLLAHLTARQRIKLEHGRYYPQWRLPILPIWFNYMGAYDCPVSFTSIEGAAEYFKPQDKPQFFS